MTAEQIPSTAVIRVSRAEFEPGRYEEIREMNVATGRYLVPAIQQLPGLISFHTGVSPDGSIVQISIWDTDEHAQQLNHLKEMAVIARGEAERAGARFLPIVHYPMDWNI
ncbi:hypothetical protein C7C46_31630 [Streptomyces tateyamensis]|uniref:ABM domain-containing protein n=1 Tax=Streptomyces tateyamensis TaxID=565073 RepID=A0A2V4N4X9_9ACTN|nr:hypothetical protein [Streptomyces tateyamensis]PYC66102.1 hypothetical protein C7C46_31630 [Streptomyces tateyamensis]